MPGPVTAYIITERRGAIHRGPLITIGHVLLELAMVIALFFGLRDLLNQNWVAGGIGVVGGLVLLWMGFDIVRSAWRGNVLLNWSQPIASAGVSRNPIIGGVVTSLFNPYWFLWWATVGAAYLITFRAFGIAGIIAFYFGHTLADWVWNNFVAFVVASGRRILSDRIYRGILAVCGAFMIAMSIYFVTSGVNFLRGWGS
jgi:threonine/homoserine/homoserine lactone efflux protein